MIIVVVKYLIFTSAVFSFSVQHAFASNLTRVTPKIYNNCTINESCEYAVDRLSPAAHIYEVEPSETEIGTANVRLLLNITMEKEFPLTLNNNLSVTVLQPSAISSSFMLPYFSKKNTNKTVENSAHCYSALRTLCLLDANPTSQIIISIIVSTGSSNAVKYRVGIYKKNDFIIGIDKKNEISVSAMKPTYFHFLFDNPTLTSVTVYADSYFSSPTNTCLTLSVQTPSCPIFDQEENVHYEGIYETMSVSGAFTIQRKSPFDTGFILVVVVHANLSECTSRDPFALLSSNAFFMSSWISLPSMFSNVYSPATATTAEDVLLTLQIKSGNKGSSGSQFLAWLTPIVVVFAIALSAGLALLRRHRFMSRPSNNIAEDQGSQTNLLASNDGYPFQDDLNQSGPSNFIGTKTRRASLSDVEVLDQQEEPNEHHDLIQNPARTSFKWSFKADIHLADFQASTPTNDLYNMEKNGYGFAHLAVIVAVFYCIPVCQFAAYYYRVFKFVGNYDMCYYNYRCAIALGYFTDFNHFISNSAYILYGFMFILFVYIHKIEYETVASQKATRQNNQTASRIQDENVSSDIVPNDDVQVQQPITTETYGLPANFGLFYALGVALIVEGVLSASYHLCPNQSTFQFDTCFMYVMSMLILVKLYQFRHPRIFKPNYTFGALAAVVTVSFVGLLVETLITPSNKIILAVCFIVIQLIVELFVAFDYVFVGYLRESENDNESKIVVGWDIFSHIFKRSTWQRKNICLGRVSLPLTCTVFSCALIGCWKYFDWGFSTYLLYLLIGHVLLSLFFYSTMKWLVHKEVHHWSWIQPSIYFGLSMIAGGIAVNFYMKVAAEFDMTAAESRAMNRECLSWLGPFAFYDSHDAWHYLSASSLFFLFMGLLVLDDDLIAANRKNIAVF